MLQRVIESRVRNAVKRYIPEESDFVKEYMSDLTILTYKNLELDRNARRDDGKPYTSSQNLRFAISITLDDMDTPMLLKEAREEEKKNESQRIKS